jgi:hypothetical protein
MREESAFRFHRLGSNRRLVLVHPNPQQPESAAAAYEGDFAYAGFDEATREQIQKMDNHQLPNPMITRGGWNCRHVWLLDISALEVRAMEAA